VVEHVLRVHADWTRRLAADPAHQVPLLAQALEKLSSKKLSEDIISAAISRVVFSTEPLSDSLTTFAKWAYDLKQARSVPDIATLVDTALLEKVLATAPKPAVPAPASAGKPDSGKP
jgi:hypothetical protein